jgi:arginyl-tRNA synthetase
LLDPYALVREKIADSIYKSCSKLKFEVSKEEIEKNLERPKEEFGDLATAIAFDIGKKLRKNPREIAEKIKGKFAGDELVEKIEVAGAGYLNFFLNPKEFAKLTLSEIFSNKIYGSNNFGKGKKALVEFPAVNPNKPWHVGHMRNAILGDAVSRILEFSGYEVEREDYIDDLGLQIAQSLWGYFKLNKKIDKKVDHWLGEQYVEVAKRMDEEKIAGEVREIVKELETEKSKTAKIGRELAEKCVKAQYETAYKLDISHDVLIWESDIVQTKMLEAALEGMLATGAIVKESDGKNAGCIVAKLEKLSEFKDLENPDRILVRSDGTATYTGKDVSFHLWKFGLLPSKFKFKIFDKQPSGRKLYTTSREGKNMSFGKADLVVNIIGVEQTHQQLAVKNVLKLMGYEKQANNMVHLAYEHAWLPEEKFSGRAGTWLGYTADEVINEAAKHAHNEIKGRFKDMAEEEKNKIADAVGIGAIRFDFVRTSPEKKIVFRWEEALNFEGDSAPYIQYSHARAARILEKAGKLHIKRVDYSHISSHDEMRLIKALAKFPSIVKTAARDYRPHYIAEYLLELATDFSKFYTSCPVLTAPEKEKNARLVLVSCTKRVLKNGLELLGIEAPERM